MTYKIWEQLVRKELGVDPSDRETAYKAATRRFCKIDMQEPANRFMLEKLKIILIRMPDHRARPKLQATWKRHKAKHLQV